MTEPFDTSNASGRFLMNILSAVAGLERDTIVERSIEGSYLAAGEGGWMGGAAPYGYRRIPGSPAFAGRPACPSRIEPSDEPIPGCDGLTEPEVVALIYNLAARKEMSCPDIA